MNYISIVKLLFIVGMFLFFLLVIGIYALFITIIIRTRNLKKIRALLQKHGYELVRVKRVGKPQNLSAKGSSENIYTFSDFKERMSFAYDYDVYYLDGNVEKICKAKAIQFFYWVKIKVDLK